MANEYIDIQGRKWIWSHTIFAKDVKDMHVYVPDTFNSVRIGIHDACMRLNRFERNEELQTVSLWVNDSNITQGVHFDAPVRIFQLAPEKSTPTPELLPEFDDDDVTQFEYRWRTQHGVVLATATFNDAGKLILSSPHQEVVDELLDQAVHQTVRLIPTLPVSGAQIERRRTGEWE